MTILAAPASFKDRGRRFDEQLALMKRIWSRIPVGDNVGPVGPPPVQRGGPELLVGAVSPSAIRRVGRWADGLITPGIPESVQQAYGVAEESWKAEGRPGRPRLVSAAYYALGPNADRGASYVRDYYGFMGDAADYMAQSILASADAIKGTIAGFSGIGVDEMIFWPTVTDLDQVDRLAEVAA